MINNQNVRYNLDRINEESNLNLDLENNAVIQTDSSATPSRGSKSQMKEESTKHKFSLTKGNLKDELGSASKQMSNMQSLPIDSSDNTGNAFEFQTLQHAEIKVGELNNDGDKVNKSAV